MEAVQESADAPSTAVSTSEANKLSKVIDLDIDIGADAIDYKYVVVTLNTGSLS